MGAVIWYSQVRSKNRGNEVHEGGQYWEEHQSVSSHTESLWENRRLKITGKGANLSLLPKVTVVIRKAPDSVQSLLKR